MSACVLCNSTILCQGLPHAQVATRQPDIQISSVKAVGNYAVNIGFSDGHSHGIYSWSELHCLGTEKFARMRAHVQRIQASQKAVQNFRAHHTRQQGSGT